MFENSFFIKPDVKWDKDYCGKNLAPMFRKKFKLSRIGRAHLFVCGLGIAYYYINGRPVSSDLFTSPVSDYGKTLWYNRYDVTRLLKEGENVFAAICGNGFFNEEFRTPWRYNEAPWRDLPQIAVQLDIDGKTVLTTDETWLCKPESAITYNALRSGEYFDLNLYSEMWNMLAYDDSTWEHPLALRRDTTFRECTCEPIRECAVYDSLCVLKSGEKKYVFDIGQNISGYIRLHVKDGFYDALTIRYAEQLNDDLSLQLNRMDSAYFYPESPFQTDRFTGAGRSFTWSPRFAYHGFRYIEIDGVTDLSKLSVQGVFVHQDVKRKTGFSCSDPFLTQLFHAGVISTYSNMFYCITDCPTREKLGWANDAQSSAEQILMDFQSENVLEKWLIDIYDAMNREGALPGIIPTSGWGFEWGNGPVSDGVLFELPYRLYLHTGNKNVLKRSLPYFEKYLRYIETKRDADGFVPFGLDDWANPHGRDFIPATFINAALIYNFYKIACLAASLTDSSDANHYLAEAEGLRERILRTYLTTEGQCVIDEQSAVAILIYYGLYSDLAPLRAQLKALVEKNYFRHYCGMVGLRKLLHALSKCGLQEYAFRILTSGGYPSYKSWFEHGATTLWENWTIDRHADSKNHHMYSDFMSWLIKNVLGIRQTPDTAGETDFTIEPYFFEKLNFAEGSFSASTGNIFVRWRRSEPLQVKFTINVIGALTVRYNGRFLKEGNHCFTVNENPS